ncbi:MAG: endo-1,4-beta-xylanase [Paludibacteraceae bacterium]
MKNKLLTLLVALFCAGQMHAQLAKDNQCKFLGNITTSYNWVEYCDPQECSSQYIYADYWNQVTCENATKWGSVHKGWGKFDWTNADRTYNYCKQKGILFKFHALIWGSQAPSWIKTLSADDTKKAIVEWFDEVKNHYPDLQVIDVVNEAIYSGSNYHSPYKETKIIEALGGQANGYPNTQSYGWLAEAFKMARERWPNAILIYNDYNTFQWQKTEFINLINGLKALNAPIDAAGCQSHDLNDMSGSNFKSALEDIHNKIQMPIYITEYDIANSNDATQATRYKEQFPVMWEADYVAGVTLWGWVYGKTWTTDGNSGIIKNCSKRSAFTWLEEYMKTDAAKNAKSPFCGSSTKVSLSSDKESYEATATVKLTATVTSTNTIKRVEFYNGTTKLGEDTSSPYEYTWSDVEGGNYKLTAIAYDSDNEKTTSSEITVTVFPARAPYTGKAILIPGILEAENYDIGGEGRSYHDSDDENEGGAYREDGVDINENPSGGGYNIGYTANGEWLEYSVNVEKTAKYNFKALVASGNENGSFNIYLDGTSIASVSVPQTADGTWDTYVNVSGRTTELAEGSHILKIEVDGGYFNLDNIEFTEYTGGQTGGDIENTCDDKTILSQFSSLKLGSANLKKLTEHNPLYTQRYGADPCAMVYNDEVFIYMTNDIYEYSNGAISTNNYGTITEINCVSSKDLVNWTDHGPMKVAGTGGISKAGNSWAPTACHAKINGKEKFFLYFANGGNGIYVVTSDTPYGPWTDVLNGQGLITRSMQNCNVNWLFDPAVLVDDDGTGYIYFGGGVPDGKAADPGTARVAKLGADFTSIVGAAVTINPPYLFEDAGINKIGKTYVYSYCTNWNTNAPYTNAEIRYMTSSNPTGPFTVQNAVFSNPGNFFSGGWGNNHHSMFKFKDQYYITYHSQLLQYRKGVEGGYRCSHIDKISVNESNAQISAATGTYAGVTQVKNFDELDLIEGETFAWNSGINTRYIDKTNMAVTEIDAGDWIGLSKVDFTKGYNTVSAKVSSKNGAAMKIVLNSPEGEVIGYLAVPATNGEFVEVSAALCDEIASVHDIFVIFSGEMELDSWSFSHSGTTDRESIASENPSITIQPNPTSDKAVLSDVEIGDAISIYSLNGVLLREIVAASSDVEIDLSDFVAGMYFIKVEDHILKVIKQ